MKYRMWSTPNNSSPENGWLVHPHLNGGKFSKYINSDGYFETTDINIAYRYIEHSQPNFIHRETFSIKEVE